MSLPLDIVLGVRVHGIVAVLIIFVGAKAKCGFLGFALRASLGMTLRRTPFGREGLERTAGLSTSLRSAQDDTLMGGNVKTRGIFAPARLTLWLGVAIHQRGIIQFAQDDTPMGVAA